MSEEPIASNQTRNSKAQPLSSRLALLWSQFGAKGRQLVRPKRHLAVLAVLAAIGWAANGIYRVQPNDFFNKSLLLQTYRQVLAPAGPTLLLASETRFLTYLFSGPASAAPETAKQP